eukprot:3108625-Rhodomonas_salina.3
MAGLCVREWVGGKRSQRGEEGFGPKKITPRIFLRLVALDFASSAAVPNRRFTARIIALFFTFQERSFEKYPDATKLLHYIMARTNTFAFSLST